MMIFKDFFEIPDFCVKIPSRGWETVSLESDFQLKPFGDP